MEQGKILKFERRRAVSFATIEENLTTLDTLAECLLEDDFDFVDELLPVLREMEREDEVSSRESLPHTRRYRRMAEILSVLRRAAKEDGGV